MTTTPDPKTVREIAREAIERAARSRDWISPVLTDHDVMREILASGDRSAWGRWNDAIRAEMETATVTVSWPAEQPQDERDGDVRAVAALLKLAALGGPRGGWLTRWEDATAELESRFADRVAALEARDAKAGEQR